MSRLVTFKFLLYVAGDTQNSAQAVANLTALCQRYLPDRYGIEVVDVFQEPKRALADCILMTPTLIRLIPTPVRRVVGTLSDSRPLMLALGLEALT